MIRLSQLWMTTHRCGTPPADSFGRSAFGPKRLAQLESFSIPGGLEYACLILDVRMPGMAAWSFSVSSPNPGTAFPLYLSLCTGNGPEEEQAMRSGASDFLRKPVSERALINAIEVALQRKFQDGERGNS